MSADQIVLHHGDCLDVMASLPDNSVDSIVTDPPYGIGFLGAAWDDLPPGEEWARECLRVLKPGGHIVAFGASRTWHRLAVAIEDAGFEMRDSIAWLYGSGMPKSMNISKAFDKAAGATRRPSGVDTNQTCVYLLRGEECPGHGDSSLSGATIHAIPTVPSTTDAIKWDGWGTTLKPSFEPIVVARKPFKGTVISNIRAHGTGGLNVDACRVETVGGRPKRDSIGQESVNDIYGKGGMNSGMANGSTTLGRWPSNVILDGPAADALDAQTGERPSGAPQNRFTDDTRASSVHSSGIKPQLGPRPGYTDKGGASKFFPVFRYQGKAPGRERPVVDGVAHTTVKPLALMEWLITLVTPPGGTVLEPFAGSGTTLEAAARLGFPCIGIEREAEYLPLIAARLARVAKATQVDEQPTLFDAA